MDHYLLQPDIRCLGHSGCRVELIHEDDRYYVVKTSSCVEYNRRLQAQANKQKTYCNQYVRVPQVYSAGFDEDGLLKVEMEFVNGADFICFLEVSTIQHIQEFGHLLLKYVECCMSRSKWRDITDQVQEKVQSVRQNIASNKFTSNLEHLVPEVRGDIKMPVGCCHGDLTLSNVLWSGGDVYLIDLLDSFIESPLIDIVKLRQDTYHGWSLSRSQSDFDRAKVSLALSFLDRAIVKRFKRVPWYRDYYHLFQRLNLCRVLQYADCPENVVLLTKEIKRV